MTDGKQLEKTPIGGYVREMTPEQYVWERTRGFRVADLRTLFIRNVGDTPCLTYEEAWEIVRVAAEIGNDELAQEIMKEYIDFVLEQGQAQLGDES